ncbi:MAG TPA: arginine--tRNA ligase [Acidimicrobiia bacterium]|nr:arginine--tRNA ligase [Acidimicrobiia bacterium]
MSLQSHLSELAGKAFADLGLPAELGEVLPSQRPELAQFQCNGAMAAAKQAGKAPRDIASLIGTALAGYLEIARTDVAGPGFINIDVTDEALADWSNRTAQDDHHGHESAGERSKVLVDYAGPNVAKAMHVGHLRATIIGDALARLYSFAGHDVIRDPHFGDWGFNMGLLIAVVQEEGLDPSTLTLDDLQRLYPGATGRANEDEAFAERARITTVALQQGDEEALTIWRQMKTVSEQSQRRDFASLGIEFDLWYGESDVADRLGPLVDRLVAEGVAEESDGALIVRVDQRDDNREWPSLLLRSTGGGCLYSTTDVAKVDMRVEELGVDLMLYVVDRRQSDHLNQVFRVARKAGIADDDVVMEHIGFGTMNGPDGKPFKTREGGVVRLGDVIDMIETAARQRLDEAHIAEDYPEEERSQIAHHVGVAALKFGDLINNRTSDYIFDLERFSSFEGKTGPYLQYAAVRIKSILRKAVERGFEPGTILAPVVDAERDLLLELLRLPEVVDRAIDLRAPNHVAEYAYALAVRWNRFYDQCHILSEPDGARRASWLSVARLTGSTLETLLHLLGIEVPDRM